MLYFLKQSRRTQNILLWGGLVTTLLLAALGIASAWFSCGCTGWLYGPVKMEPELFQASRKQAFVWLYGGALHMGTRRKFYSTQIALDPMNERASVWCERTDEPGLEMWSPWPRRFVTSSMSSIIVPVHLTIIPSAFITCIAWNAKRRAKRVIVEHRCANCDYVLRGCASGSPCPECGNVQRPSVSLLEPDHGTSKT